MKSYFLLLTCVFVFSGCTSAPLKPRTVVQLPLDETTLKLNIQSEDRVRVGDFFLLDSGDSYVSIQVLSASDESDRWGISTQGYLDQLYGLTQPEIDEVASTKQALSGSVVKTEYLTHERYFAIYQKEQDDRERIFFTDKTAPSSTYYILETEGKDSRKIFYGEN